MFRAGALRVLACGSTTALSRARPVPRVLRADSAPGDRAADHGRRVRGRDALCDDPGGELQGDGQARLPNGAAAPPLRIEGLEGEPGRRAVLDHHDDAGVVRSFDAEASL